MQQEEGCGGEQQYLEHDALEERAELVRVEQDRAARDVVEGDKLDRAVVAAVIGIGHAADGIAGLDGSGDLLGDVGLKLEILYVKLLGEQGNEIVLGDEDDLVGIGRELDFGVGDLLACRARVLEVKFLKPHWHRLLVSVKLAAMVGYSFELLEQPSTTENSFASPYSA